MSLVSQVKLLSNEYGLVYANSNAYMMIYSNNVIFAMLFIYVNDMRVMKNNTDFINNLIIRLNSILSLKDLGELSYFLEVDVTQTIEGLHLAQNKYIHNPLEKVQLNYFKLVYTPIQAKRTLIKQDDT